MKPALAKVLTPVLVTIGLVATQGSAQDITYDRDRAQNMLKDISSDVKKHYYDPGFHGVNWDARVQEAKARINAADSMSQALSEVAAALLSLDDSHTYFVPPGHYFRYDYGWQAQMIGERCLITRVRPGSDAEKKGIKPGDELVELGGYPPNRANFWKIEYVIETLRPQSTLQLEFGNSSGARRHLDVATTVIRGKQVTDLTGNDIWGLIRQEENAEHRERARFSELSDDVGILKVPVFNFSKQEADGMIAKARARKGLVLDLRGNKGGDIGSLDDLIAGFFEKEVKIADLVGRSDRKPLIAKPHGRPFTGKLAVLVDSDSASAAELFARVVQLEKRGTVVGDKSSGSVMAARHFSYQLGTQKMIFFAASITEADLIMSDGVSLEHKGVSPDELLLPSAQDLAKGRDPVLARAVEMVGGKLSPEDAGKLLPYEWPEL